MGFNSAQVIAIGVNEPCYRNRSERFPWEIFIKDFPWESKARFTPIDDWIRTENKKGGSASI